SDGVKVRSKPGAGFVPFVSAEDDKECLLRQILSARLDIQAPSEKPINRALIALKELVKSLPAALLELIHQLFIRLHSLLFREVMPEDPQKFPRGSKKIENRVRRVVSRGNHRILVVTTSLAGGVVTTKIRWLPQETSRLAPNLLPGGGVQGNAVRCH